MAEADGPVLEIGVGTGRLLAAALDRGINLRGMGDGSVCIALDETVTGDDLTDILEERTRAEIIYSGSSAGIWDWIDVKGEKVYWSSRFYHLLGYQPGEIPASLSSFNDLLHPDDRERTFALVDRHLAGEAPFDIEYRLRTKAGEYRWFHGIGEAVDTLLQRSTSGLVEDELLSHGVGFPPCRPRPNPRRGPAGLRSVRLVGPSPRRRRGCPSG